MRIGLYGISGVYNFGCEAIVRGAVNLISSIHPTAMITYYSYSMEYDTKALSDLNIRIVGVSTNKKISRRLNNKIRTLLHLDRRQLFFDYKRIIDENDIIMSIGGDIYTIPKYVRQQKKYSYYNPLVDFCDRAILCGKKVVVYGGSIGPFGEYRQAVDYYAKYLKKYSLILCREFESIHYLNELGVDNVLFFPDPAFQVRNTIVDNVKRRRFAINFSPLSYMECYGTIDKDVYIRLANLIDQIIEKYDVEILLVPHVVAEDPIDNDALFLGEIFKLVSNKDSVVMADFEGGFLGIKKQLETCIITVAARMHCAINSIVENIPTIFLSYSQKSIGMAEYIYGDRRYVIRIEDVDSKLIEVLDDVYGNQDNIINLLITKNSEIHTLYLNHIKLIKDKMSKMEMDYVHKKDGKDYDS